MLNDQLSNIVYHRIVQHNLFYKTNAVMVLVIWSAAFLSLNLKENQIYSVQMFC